MPRWCPRLNRPLWLCRRGEEQRCWQDSRIPPTAARVRAGWLCSWGPRRGRSRPWSGQSGPSHPRITVLSCRRLAAACWLVRRRQGGGRRRRLRMWGLRGRKRTATRWQLQRAVSRGRRCFRRRPSWRPRRLSGRWCCCCGCGARRQRPAALPLRRGRCATASKPLLTSSVALPTTISGPSLCVPQPDWKGTPAGGCGRRPKRSGGGGSRAGGAAQPSSPS